MPLYYTIHVELKFEPLCAEKEDVGIEGNRVDIKGYYEGSKAVRR